MSRAMPKEVRPETNQAPARTTPMAKTWLAAGHHEYSPGRVAPAATHRPTQATSSWIRGWRRVINARNHCSWLLADMTNLTTRAVARLTARAFPSATKVPVQVFHSNIDASPLVVRPV